MDGHEGTGDGCTWGHRRRDGQGGRGDGRAGGTGESGKPRGEQGRGSGVLGEGHVNAFDFPR